MSLSRIFENIKKEMNYRPNWNEYFMSNAILISLRSPCERLKVGCVIVKNNHIISSAYNGYITGFKHESVVRDDHEQMIVHAEQNALCDVAKRGVSINDSIIYITHFPCINCFKNIISCGIKEIYYLHDYKNDDLVIKLINDYNIKCQKINL